MLMITIPKQRRSILLFLYLISAILFVCLVSIFIPTFLLVQHQNDHHAMDVRQIHAQPIDIKHQTNVLQDQIPILEHESLVWNTIKSCWPDTNIKCNQLIPEPPPNADPIDTGTVEGAAAVVHKKHHHQRQLQQQRIGVLAPPGDLSQSLLNRVRRLAKTYNQALTNDDPIEIAVIPTSHVPPYGYGKNHGYTKLIRFMPNPLLLQVLDALVGSLVAGESHSILTIVEVISATRLLLRWHCRLSHIAAHTALASIPMMDFIANANGEIDSTASSYTSNVDAVLEAFVQSSPSSNTKKQQPANRQAEEESVRTGDDNPANPNKDDDDHPEDDDRLGMVEAEWSHLYRILENLGGFTKIGQVLDTVLMEELTLSKNFTVWPCPSFWAVSPLGQVGQRLAKALSPDCNDPYVNCFVARDKCEFLGDAECNENHHPTKSTLAKG